MKKIIVFVLLCLPITIVGADGSANDGCTEPISRTGVNIAPGIAIQKGTDGLTVEQRNVGDRLKMDNKPGSIKHLYVISAYSGQVLIYSTVRGKVTSSAKRLTPGQSSGNGFSVQMSATTSMLTNEVLGDDGTYGGSVEYLYWWDTRGIYHQHYVQGGQILHISDQPLAVKSIVLNMETTNAEATK